jgi:hypothetical protein
MPFHFDLEALKLFQQTGLLRYYHWLNHTKSTAGALSANCVSLAVNCSFRGIAQLLKDRTSRMGTGKIECLRVAAMLRNQQFKRIKNPEVVRIGSEQHWYRRRSLCLALRKYFVELLFEHFTQDIFLRTGEWA